MGHVGAILGTRIAKRFLFGISVLDPLTYTLVDDFLTMEYSGSGDVTGALVPTNDIVLPPGPTASTSSSGCEPADFTPASTTEDQVALIQ